jgi:hypothetical protein
MILLVGLNVRELLAVGVVVRVVGPGIDLAAGWRAPGSGLVVADAGNAEMMLRAELVRAQRRDAALRDVGHDVAGRINGFPPQGGAR